MPLQDSGESAVKAKDGLHMQFPTTLSPWIYEKDG
jgi:hypothetical protein